MYEQLSEVISEFPEISLISTESLFVNSFKTGGRNKSASIVATNMVTGAIFLLAAQRGIPVRQYTPGAVKKYIAGFGDASKGSVEGALSNIIMANSIDVGSDHQSDAIAISWTAAMEIAQHGLEYILESGTKKSVSKKSKRPRIIKTKEFVFKGVKVDKSKKKPEHILHYLEGADKERLREIKELSISGRFKGASILVYDNSESDSVSIGYEVGKKHKANGEVIPETLWYCCEYVGIEEKSIQRYYGNLLRKLEKNTEFACVQGGRVVEVLSEINNGLITMMIGVEVEVVKK